MNPLLPLNWVTATAISGLLMLVTSKLYLAFLDSSRKPTNKFLVQMFIIILITGAMGISQGIFEFFFGADRLLGMTLFMAIWNLVWIAVLFVYNDIFDFIWRSRDFLNRSERTLFLFGHLVFVITLHILLVGLFLVPEFEKVLPKDNQDPISIKTAYAWMSVVLAASLALVAYATWLLRYRMAMGKDSGVAKTNEHQS
jgi:hypothetical protein